MKREEFKKLNAYIEKYNQSLKSLTAADLNIMPSPIKQVDIRENGLKHLRAKQMKRSRK